MDTNKRAIYETIMNAVSIEVKMQSIQVVFMKWLKK
jgi:hypothetical protein